MNQRKSALIAGGAALLCIPLVVLGHRLMEPSGEMPARLVATAPPHAAASFRATAPPLVRALAPTSTPAPIPAPPVKVVTIGDSIMAGFGLQPADAWPTLLATSDGITVTNLGCSGAGFIAVGQCGTNFNGLIAQAAAADPTLVIIQSSDNDLGQSSADLAQATTTTLENLRAALPQVRIVAFNTLWDQPGPIPDEVPESTSDVQSAASAVGGTFVNLGQPLDGHTALLQSDSEHPTLLGQESLLHSIQVATTDTGVPL